MTTFKVLNNLLFVLIIKMKEFHPFCMNENWEDGR